MRILVLISLLVMSASLFAANGKKDVDGLTFTLEGQVWVQQGLEEGSFSPEFAAVFGDGKWQRWNHVGSATMRKILALGPNVVFRAPAQDGELRVFSVHQNSTLLKGSVSYKASVKTTTRSLLGSALFASAQRGGDPVTPHTP